MTRVQKLAAAIRDVRPGYSEPQARALAAQLDGEAATADEVAEMTALFPGRSFARPERKTPPTIWQAIG